MPLPIAQSIAFSLLPECQANACPTIFIAQTAHLIRQTCVSSLDCLVGCFEALGKHLPTPDFHFDLCRKTCSLLCNSNDGCQILMMAAKFRCNISNSDQGN